MASKTASRINAGEYKIAMDGKQYTLSPSLAAFNRLAQLGAFDDVRDKIMRRDAGTISVVIRWGLGWKDDQARRLPELMYKTGLSALWEPCYRYFFALYHDGKTVEEVNEELEARRSAGDEPSLGQDAEGNELTGA